MITKFESYEPDEDELNSEESQSYINAANYMKDQLPKDEFVDWSYSDKGTVIKYTFYFDKDSSDDVKNNIGNFLSKHNLTYDTDYSSSWRTNYDVSNNDGPKIYLIVTFYVMFSLVDYFADLYLQTSKYNL